MQSKSLERLEMYYPTDTKGVLKIVTNRLNTLVQMPIKNIETFKANFYSEMQ